MSTNANPAPTEKVTPSVKLAAAIQTLIKAEVQTAIARDAVLNVAKSETVRLAIADKKALTMLLFASGLTDARTVSEVVGFVFPASDSARKELDKAMEANAKQTDPKKRIAKPVILALQRDKTGKLTLEKALKEHTLSRQPGGKTDPTEKAKAKKPTAKEVEEELGNLLAAAIAYGKEHGYDNDDLNQVWEDSTAAAFTDDEADETEEDDKD